MSSIVTSGFRVLFLAVFSPDNLAFSKMSGSMEILWFLFAIVAIRGKSLCGGANGLATNVSKIPKLLTICTASANLLCGVATSWASHSQYCSGGYSIPSSCSTCLCGEISTCRLVRRALARPRDERCSQTSRKKTPAGPLPGLVSPAQAFVRDH
jgi:hypothetical protein